MNEGRPNTGVMTQPLTDAGWLVRIIASLQRLFRVSAAGDRVLKRLETLPIGSRTFIYLIECDGQRFLVSDGLSSPVPLHRGTAVSGSERER